MSKSLTLSCGGTVDISNHSKRNMQYRAPIHKIQHVFADTVYGVISANGNIDELVWEYSFRPDKLLVVSTNKRIGDYNSDIKVNDRFILTKQTNVRFNGVFESIMDSSPYWVIKGVQHYVSIWKKMQFGGNQIKQLFTANAELTNSVLSEDGLILRHNTVEAKQGDNTFGGMPVTDYNKDFVITIELQTDDLRQNGVYGINTTDDFHGTYRNFHRLPWAEYDGEHKEPYKYNTTWCGINVVTDNGEHWYGQSLHSEDYALDSRNELTMNVDWKRGSDASMVLIHQNYPNMFNEIITIKHRFESLDGNLEYTADKNTIIVTGDYSGHIGASLNDGEISIVRDTIDLPAGSDGFYTIKNTNDGFELIRLVSEFVETNILNLSLVLPFYFGEIFIGNGTYLISSTEDYIYKETRLPPNLPNTRFPNFYIRNPVVSYLPPIKSGVIDLNQHIVANQFKLTHTVFQASYGVDISLINNLAEKGLCLQMDQLLQNQGYSSAGILQEKQLAANITIMIEAHKRTTINTRDNLNYDSVGINNTINYRFVYRDGTPISDEDALAVGRITLHFNYEGFSILN